MVRIRVFENVVEKICFVGEILRIEPPNIVGDKLYPISDFPFYSFEQIGFILRFACISFLLYHKKTKKQPVYKPGSVSGKPDVCHLSEKYVATFL